ncbi:MAG: DUF885 family protein, partial [Bacteroidota bacterium]|nr:DUF885 family protein [Bacteroidota bacterium]
MKKLALAGLVAAALTTACNQTKTTETATTSAPGTAADSTKSLSGLFASFWEQQSRLDPLSATAQGDNRFNDQLPNDQTQAFRDTLTTFYQDYLGRLGKFDRAGLDENDKISYDIFQYDLRQRVEGLKLNTWMMPFQQFWGLPLSMGQY